MIVLFRWLIRLFIGASVLAGLVAALFYYLGSRSLPDYDATHAAAGLAAPLEIVRDNSNVPHIFGQTDTDSYFGLGYVHAQDRLWQMLMLRMTVQGRLSETFGERTFAVDRLMRRLDFYTLAQQSQSAQDSYGSQALAAYARGVNARIARINEAAMGRGAPELFLFPMAIAPWTPTDSLAISRLLALQMSNHAENEVKRARAGLMLDPDRLMDLMPVPPGDGVAALPGFAALFPGFSPETGPLDRDHRLALAPVVPLPGLQGASNAFAAAPDRAAKRGSLLATDPHLGLGAPSLMYLARLDLYSGPVIGATIPGMPLVLIGRSPSLGWGLTSSGLDDLDVMIEAINPDNPDQYRSADGWATLRKRDTIITIKDAAPRTVTLKWSANGPLIPEGTWGLNKITPPGHLPAISWTALTPRDGTMSAFLQIMQAHTVDNALAAGESVVAPSVNIVLADKTGVGLGLLGAIPRRSPHHQSLGRIPTPGWRTENQWLGRLDYGSNPRFVAPEGGIVGNTNNKLIERPFPLHISYDWGDTQRVQRWQKLMQERRVHTRESFMEAQLDTVSPAARTLLPLIGRDLFFSEAGGPDDSPEGRRKRALDLLAAWSGEMNEHRPEPLIYAAWMNALTERLIRDDLGAVADDFARPDPLFLERVYRDVDGASAWCDVHQSTRIETCADIARLALDDAILWLGRRYGGSLESLRWGAAHETRADHQVLGSVPGLGWIVNIRQSTSGGDFTLRRGKTGGGAADPFLNVHAAVFRGVFDFADPDSSVFITSTGQSGHPLSRYYDDMAGLWRRGEYVPMILNPELARTAAVGITRLTPK